MQIPILDGALTLDILATHTAADPDQDKQDYDNIYYREKQINQILDDVVDTSDADVVILSGDLNSTPNGANLEKEFCPNRII